jgi:HSP20 family protein
MSQRTDVPATTQESKPRRWDPFDFASQMQSEFDRLMGGWLPSFRGFRRPNEMGGAWAPRTDVYEHDGSIVVKAELPGVDKKDINVAIEDGDLVIQGERRSEETVNEKDFYRMERSYGSFYRRLPLPEGVSSDKIDAKYADGILEVKVPKPAMKETAPTKIEIK